MPDQPRQDFLREPAVRRPVRCRRDKKADPALPAARCQPQAPCALLCTGTAWAAACACPLPALAGGERCGRTLTAHGARAADDDMELPSVHEELRRFFMPQLYVAPAAEKVEEKVCSRTPGA